MAKPKVRAYSRYAREAAATLGLAIRNARIERRMTAAEAAERADISRGLLQRVEAGDLGASIGAVFELAAVVGVPLIEADLSALSSQKARELGRKALLPKAVKRPAKRGDDAF